jgi:1-aminocyclopropane-1-carboxylate deaminase/D-cysteine desulfhydrase-like pyridoxal-dependent ACC family enzyme
VTLHLKRDDLSSFDLSGNKVRKLEFLLGELRGCDSVVTTGALPWRRASWA